MSTLTSGAKTMNINFRNRMSTMKYRLNAKIGDIGRRMVRWSQRDSNYLHHAHSEWKIAFREHDDMQNAIGENVIDMVAMFGLGGHSGFSARYAQRYIEKALKFEPFSLLTGDESEWGEPFDSDGTQQNKRCSHVFREKDGRSYDINGRVFVEPNGVAYTNSESRVDVVFPYTPATEYIHVAEHQS